MRTTLTIIIALALSLAIGVMTASADNTLDACTNNKGTQYNLLTATSECKSSQVPTTFTAPSATSARVLSDTVYEVESMEVGDEGEGVSCEIHDIGFNVIPSKRKGSLGFYVECAPGYSIQTIDDMGTTFTAICADAVGDTMPPAYIRIRCTIDTN